MKKKYIATLVAIMLLAGCGTPAPAAPSTTDEPDMEAIIQQSVDEAVKEKLEQIEEEQKKKDEEIAKLKEQLEDLTAQSEAPPEESSSAPTGDAPSQAPASSQPAAPASSSQPEIPPQPEPEPPPQSAPAPTKQPAKAKPVNEGTIFEGYEVKVSDWSTPAVSSGGRDWPISTWYFWGPGETVLGSISGKALTAITEKYQVKAAAGGTEAPGGGGDWSTWLAEMFNEYRSVTGGGNVSSGESSSKELDEDENGQQAGAFLEDDALEVVRLTNEERANHGVGTLEIDEDLMALAKIRAEEVSTKYSHERPDGSHVVQMGYGENVGAKGSAEKQVTSWMGSDGHRTNILREVYTRIGVGCYQTEGGKYYWVQIFSR